MDIEHQSLVNFLADINEQCEFFLNTRRDEFSKAVLNQVKMLLMSSAVVVMVDGRQTEPKA